MTGPEVTAVGTATAPGRGAGGPAAASAGSRDARPVSSTTVAAREFVAARLEAARALGTRLAEEIDDPAAFVAATREGLAALSDPAFLAGERLVAPGIGLTLGVRTPLLDAVLAGLRLATAGVRPPRLLAVADAVARDEVRELRWMAIRVLGWILPDDPEVAWQVLRRIGQDADDWITIDTLAGVTAAGILREPFRWAELEQLAFSPSRWERRLVGSTIANLPHVDHRLGRTGDVIRRGLALVGELLGDNEPDVQKALSWALRELARVDPAPVAAFCREEADQAAAADDGHRAWVLRDVLAKLPPADAAFIRARLAGVRRVPGAPSSSRAAATAIAFTSAGSAGSAGATGSTGSAGLGHRSPGAPLT